MDEYQIVSDKRESVRYRKIVLECYGISFRNV